MVPNSFTIHQHTHWNPLKSFQLSQDVYEEWSAFCMEDGQLDYQLGNLKGTAELGHIIFCPPHIPMRRFTPKPLKFHFLRFTPSEPLVLPSYVMKVRNQDRLRTTFSVLTRLAFVETPAANEVKAHLLKDLLLIDQVEHQRIEPNPFDTIQDRLIKKALVMIQRRAFRSPITIKEIASQLGLSNVQFSRRFAQAVGIPPVEYLSSLRMRKARNYLLETDRTIEDIANLVGYQNGFYFSRMFKQKVGINPSEFRKRHNY